MERAEDFLGRGLGFPVQPDREAGRFQMVSAEEDIRQAIALILSTHKGERVMRPDFGSNLSDYAFETMDYATISRMEKDVADALTLWEPRIRDVEAEIRVADASAGRLAIEIRYVVRTTNNPYNVVYPYYLDEGMAEF